MKPKLLKSKGHPPGLKLLDHCNQHRLLLGDEGEGFGESDTVSCRPASSGSVSSNSWGARPLIAVPFKWEAEPGVPKHQDPMAPRTQALATDDAERDSQQKGNNKSAQVVAQSLAPPPRLMIPSNGSNNSHHRRQLHKFLDQHPPAPPKSPMALNSPRSPRSISLSKRMKSLLQGKLKRSSSSSSSSVPSSPCAAFSPKVYDDSSASSPCSPYWVADFDLDKRAATKHQEQEEHDAESCTSVSRSSSSDIVFDFSSFPVPSLKGPSHFDHRGPPKIQQQSQSDGMHPFKNMSNMLLELWYGGDGGSNLALVDSGFVSPSASSSSSSDLESPGSSTDNSMSSFSSDYESINPVPRRDHQIKTSFDNDGQCGRHFLGLAAQSEPERVQKVPIDPASCKKQDIDQSCKQDESDGEIADEDFSLDFDDYRDFLADRFCFKSERFRVESTESAALVSSIKHIEMQADDPCPHQQQKKALPSALKKKDSFKSNVNASLKKVRFAVVEDVRKFEQDEAGKQEEDPEQEIEHEDHDQDQVLRSSSGNSVVLSRYSSSRRYDLEEDELTPSPRIKRDISQVLLHIVRTDAELNRKQKGGALKLFSRW